MDALIQYWNRAASKLILEKIQHQILIQIFSTEQIAHFCAYHFKSKYPTLKVLLII